MITELAVERVEFTCGHCWHQWSCDYDVQRYTDDTSQDWEYFALDGHPAESPYTPSGAQPCPGCGGHWVGRILARRPVPTPPGADGWPREQVADPVGHRAERHHAPMLGARTHLQPDQLGPPAVDDAVPDPARSAPDRSRP
ncbi:hypothetical protein DN069_07990 [Streptacidiphilus pinicola]|uniref:Uncharacterized protein n=1 Tax=Streptacidiphilus pinicola TaxID=2219663 RepID=A0A2X0J779_9ACTN|nr:hypothetical protein [Streptacidiphilus pinicola]RAG86116.1 hypothetical protein DN069_07990 [Streptacidiphilus pinicola]